MIAIDILISRTVTLQKHRFSLSVDAFACADFFTPFFPLSRPQKFSASAADVSLIMRREKENFPFLSQWLPTNFALRQFPFSIFDAKTGECIGSLTRLENDTANYFQIYADRYELRAHSGNKHSLLKNGVQIALFTKAVRSDGMRADYTLYLDETGEHDLARLLLIAAYIDCRYYTSLTPKFYAFQWEKTYIYDDEFSECAAWTPEQKNYNLEERI